jgi:hypothetical protein
MPTRRSRTTMSHQITDSDGMPLRVGQTVHCGVPGSHDPEDYATVVSISDVDGDLDDEGRPVFFMPRVSVRYADGQTDDFATETTATGPWDRDNAPYECGDVTVAPHSYC